MSLFGTSPDSKSSPNAKTNQSLFEDDSNKKPTSSSGLFAEETTAPGKEEGEGEEESSLWGSSKPDKKSKKDPVRTLLPVGQVPASYFDTFWRIHEVHAADDPSEPTGDGAAVKLSGVEKVLEASNLSAIERAQILEIVVPSSQQSETTTVGAEQFNVLLALIALAQEREEISLDSVDERKAKLPEPSLPNLETRRAPDPATPKKSEATRSSQQEPTPKSTRAQDKNMPDTLTEDPTSDPWASPGNALKQPKSGSAYDQRPQSGGESLPHRTTSTFSSTAAEDAPVAAPKISDDSHGARDSGWGGLDFGEAEHFGGGFTGPSAESGQDSLNTPKRRSQRLVSQGAEEVLIITALPEKEGSFLFQYRNYEISSSRKGTKVIRRYSDFAWLLDCLHKRYPFRQLPLLPPKRVSINGKHLATDATFIDKRRKGLSRFANALIRHPVLREEQLVTMFLTVPTELSAWRKQASITVQEEFAGKPLPPDLEDSLPPNLEDTFSTVRSGVRRAAELYINICSVLERLIKRRDGIAAEYSRLSASLENLTETSPDTYHMLASDGPIPDPGILAASKHLGAHRGLLDDESRAWDEGVLEDFKAQRDCLVSVRDMFDRRDRYAKDNIPQLEKRIAGNENKLAGVRAKPEGSRKPGDAEKLEEAIMSDKSQIVNLHARSIHISRCLQDEISDFQNSQPPAVARLMREWAGERVKYAEIVADNWRGFDGVVGE